MMIAVSSSARSTGASIPPSVGRVSSGPRVHTGVPRSVAAAVAAVALSCHATTSDASASSRT